MAGESKETQLDNKQPGRCQVLCLQTCRIFAFQAVGGALAAACLAASVACLICLAWGGSTALAAACLAASVACLVCLAWGDSAAR